MITAGSKFRNTAAAFSAKVITVPTEDGKQIEVTAPEGTRWAEGPSTLIAHHGGTWGTIEEAFADLTDRMMAGGIESKTEN